MSFADRLRSLVEEQDISQKKVAQDSNISPAGFGNYIRGIREPDFETVKMFARYFNVSTDYLLEYTDEKMQNFSVGQIEILRIFDALNAQQQELFIQQGKVLIRFNLKK